MKQLTLIGLALFMVLGSISCNAQGNNKSVPQKATLSKVEIYYFHFTRRCNTCMSVESTAKQAVENLYPDKVRNGVYTFKAINLDDENSKAIAEKLSVGGQTLLVVCGNKKVDITDKGFMDAHDLNKMKIDIKEAIEQATNNK